jgi:hypothetical protein
VTDRLHDHLTFGFRRGCVACAQTEADFARAKRATTICAMNAVGEALWESVMDGDPEAISLYANWLQQGVKPNSEVVAPLRV